MAYIILDKVLVPQRDQRVLEEVLDILEGDLPDVLVPGVLSF